ncbi:MAG: hypothetical protein KDK74_15480 [Cephaloticoccus sp.]|nr:hypothetical protein [Cephaloticoccus sp.]
MSGHIQEPALAEPLALLADIRAVHQRADKFLKAQGRTFYDVETGLKLYIADLVAGTSAGSNQTRESTKEAA